MIVGVTAKLVLYSRFESITKYVVSFTSNTFFISLQPLSILKDFDEIFKNDQIRDWYQNDSSINARVTINKINGEDEIIVDFKEEDKSDEILKETRESLPLKVENNIDAINSILDILGYKIDVHYLIFWITS